MSVFALLTIVFALPIAASALVYTPLSLIRKKQTDYSFGSPSEKLILFVMVFPALIGLIFFLGVPFIPYEVPDLRVLPPLSAEYYAVSTEMNTAASPFNFNWPYGLAYTFLALYLAPIPQKLWRLSRAQKKIRRALLHSKDASSFLGKGARITEECITPFASLCGKVVMPRILMNVLSTTQISLIVKHEHTHLQRRDPLYYLALTWVEIVLWINPFIRLQARQCRIAAEIACDAAVIHGSPTLRKTYAQSLLLALKYTAGTPLQFTPTIFQTHAKGEYKMRITQIMQGSTEGRKSLAKTLVLPLALLLVPISAIQFSYAATSTTQEVIFSVKPLDGRLTSSFGNRRDPFTKKTRFHRGVDISAPSGTPILAPAAGRILRTEENLEGYGNLLEVDHGNGLVTRYGQLLSIDVKQGQRINAGQHIAKVGSTGRSTGPHLHLELIKDGEPIDPASVIILPGSK